MKLDQAHDLGLQDVMNEVDGATTGPRIRISRRGDENESLITGTARRRYWSTEQKLRIIEQSFEPGETVSSVARRHGAPSNLLYRWRRLMSEGGAAAVGSDEPVVGNSEVRKIPALC